MQPIFEAKPQRYDDYLKNASISAENHCLFDWRADSCAAQTIGDEGQTLNIATSAFRYCGCS